MHTYLYVKRLISYVDSRSSIYIMHLSYLLWYSRRLNYIGLVTSRTVSMLHHIHEVGLFVYSFVFMVYFKPDHFSLCCIPRVYLRSYTGLTHNVAAIVLAP